MTVEARTFEATCQCGNRFQVEAIDEPEQLECVACGDDVFSITEIGRIVR
jgi:hypothetical protein